ncbi:dihydrodipicolinate synthase family protein [bacterium]|nr:dihydrodipicolinate synthase family protein [bacterium]
MRVQDISPSLLENIRRGVVIPAMPLALDADRRLSPKHQKALVRYYVDAGAGGIAVGVHSTQFEIRDPDVGLFEPVLRLASAEIDAWSKGRKILKIAGVCGPTEQALREVAFARKQGYHAGLLSLAALSHGTIPQLIDHCQAVAEVLPLIGFYLQPAVGGRVLSFDFWRRFAEIENVLAIKIAPFNRYQTLDVIRAVCDAGREKDIVLYTGNDDNIVADLLTPWRIGDKRVRIAGGLLGHWCVWTKKAVELLADIHAVNHADQPIPPWMLTLGAEVTDCNAVFFDVTNGFAGCIPGIHEVLRRQGLLPGTWCLNPKEALSPGQSEEIDRVYQAYPHLNDDAFVRENRERWLDE